METRYLVKQFEIFPQKSEISENNPIGKYISVWNQSPFKAINVTWELWTFCLSTIDIGAAGALTADILFHYLSPK